MADFASVIGNLVTGVFGAVAVVLGWRLKASTDASDRAYAKEVARRAETKELYASIYSSLEQSINQVKSTNEFRIDKELSQVNAKVHLFASKKVAERYYETASEFAEWSRLYILASPHTYDAAGNDVACIQAPGSAAKYKDLAAKAYEELNESLGELVDAMRDELQSDT